MTAQAAHNEFALPEDCRDISHAIRPTVMNATWDARLVYELALGIDDLSDICLRHQVSQDQVLNLFENNIFRAEVSTLRKELQTEGITIQRKARTQFESYLVDLDSIIRDVDTPAATKVSAIQYVGKVGDVEPKKEKDTADVMQGVNIVINI